MDNTYWSYILTIVGLLGFVAVGQKVWWAWYVNLFCQALWFTYSVTTQQWGFFIGAVAYTLIFALNAYKWTRERYAPLWVGESETAKLTNIQAYTTEEAARKFHIVFHHDPKTLCRVEDTEPEPVKPLSHAKARGR